MKDILARKKKFDNFPLYFTVIAHRKNKSVDIIANKDDVVVAFQTKKTKRKDRDDLMKYLEFGIGNAYTSQFRFKA